MEPEHEPLDETGRNPTQERMDEEGVEERRVDVDWDEPSSEDDDQGADPAA